MDDWKFEFPAAIQQQRQVVLAAIDRAMDKATPEAVREAGELAWAWVAQYPDDYAVWDAGEPLALLAEAIDATTVPEASAVVAISC